MLYLSLQTESNKKNDIRCGRITNPTEQMKQKEMEQISGRFSYFCKNKQI